MAREGSRGVRGGTALAGCGEVLPSFLHEFLTAVFRHCGELAREVVSDQVALPSSEWISRSSSEDLSQILPTQHLVDLVLTFHRRGRDGQDRPPELVILVEVQLAEDRRKHTSWPSYVANAAARFQCDVVLLVVTDKASVARWAKGPFGTSQMPLVPAVFCLSEMPRRLLEDEAPQLPVVAVLQALAHPDEATVKAALRALSEFPEQLRELCFVAIERAAPEAFRHSIEEGSMIAEYLLESEFFRRHYGRVKEAGLAEGLAEGEARAREGALALHRGIALELMQSKLPQVTGEHEARLQQLSDETALARLIVDLGRAADAEQAQAAWALAVDRSARRAGSTSDE
jgi:hypothetical protein